MIVISTYNPDVKRTTDDEELLSTLLAALVRHLVTCEAAIRGNGDDVQKAYFKAQKLNCNRLVGLTYPLLGLDYWEVEEITREEREKWRIDHIGNK